MTLCIKLTRAQCLISHFFFEEINGKFPRVTIKTTFSTKQIQIFNRYFLWLGGIFPEKNDEMVNAFQNAAKMMNTFSSSVKLETIVTNVDINDSFKVQKAGRSRFKA